MKFAKLAVYLEKLEKTPSRNEITKILADLFKETPLSEIDQVVYLLAGRLLPNYKGVEFNIAEKLMFQILAKAYERDSGEVEQLFKAKGDLGAVAFAFAGKLRRASKSQNLSVSDVYGQMFAISQESGTGSQDRKINLMADLLTALDPLSVRFVARIPIGNLRLGFSDMTILDALSFMLKGDKSARKEIEDAFNVNVDIGVIAKKVKAKGLAGIKNVDPYPGIPIRPSLAERLPTAEKILEKVGQKVYVEPKYDGFRAQVSIWTQGHQKKVAIFSRNLENTTLMFPDLVSAVKKIKVESAIFDAEAIAYNVKTGKFLPFQETSQRKRKHGIPEAARRLPLKLFVFDILYKDGKSFLHLPFAQRRKILERTVAKVGDIVAITDQEVVDSADKIRDLIKRYLSEGLEGAMIKKIDAPYKAGARGYHWVKYKKTTEEGVADTIDCLVMGIYKGKGKRAGFGVGAFLAGVLDPTSSRLRGASRFKTVSKIGTGLTDEQWREMKTRSTKLEIRNKPPEYEVDKNLEPDVWVKPSLVVEILADEITISPIHTAGLALRFPRLIRFRDDKNPQQATTVKELKKLYKMQKA
ncbi:MAG: ATP-dependent DNA ligase [Patescibacteria group bacterium]